MGYGHRREARRVDRAQQSGDAKLLVHTLACNFLVWACRSCSVDMTRTGSVTSSWWEGSRRTFKVRTDRASAAGCRARASNNALRTAKSGLVASCWSST